MLSPRQILAQQTIFLVTGLVSTLGAQWLNYNKAADSRSLLTVMCTYLGMCCIHFMPIKPKHQSTSVPLREKPKHQSTSVPLRDLASSSSTQIASTNQESHVNHMGVAMVAVLDVFGQVVLTVGLFYIGSGLYQVIYSSVIVFAAIYNRIFLGRSMTIMSWAAIFTITLGLALTSVGGNITHSEEFDDEELARRTSIGFFLTVIGTAIFSGCYTLNDALMTGTERKASPRDQCLYVGIYSTAFCFVLMLCISVPTLLSMPVCYTLHNSTYI